MLQKSVKIIVKRAQIYKNSQIIAIWTPIFDGFPELCVEFDPLFLLVLDKYI